jgi:molybdopterin-containing oxidoreductase family iron-sulfur binding subunit
MDGEIVLGLRPSCPPGGHRIGDMRDPNSRISQLLRREDGERAFHALESINAAERDVSDQDLNAGSEFFAKENA